MGVGCLTLSSISTFFDLYSDSASGWVCMHVCGTAQHGIAWHVSSASVFHAASSTYIYSCL